jgi:hypothetical protein
MPSTDTLTAPLTLEQCLRLANGDPFAACIVDAATRRNRGLYPFDQSPAEPGKKRGQWRVTAAELAGMGYWSRFAGDGAGWPSERCVPGRLSLLRPVLAELGIIYSRDKNDDAVWHFEIASTRRRVGSSGANGKARPRPT